MKSFKVSFATSSVGKEGHKLGASLPAGLAEFGAHWPIIDLGGSRYQIRDLRRVVGVWHGTFAQLRDDAPNIVRASGQEDELALADDDLLIDKCHFLYRQQADVLIWQVNRAAGSLGAAERYLSRVLDAVVQLPPVVNSDRLQEVLAGDVYELEFSFARPPLVDEQSPSWFQDSFDLINSVHAARARFNLRGQRRGKLTGTVKRMVRSLMNDQAVAKVKVRMTDETDLVEIVTAPVRDSFKVELYGRYPAASDVFQELEAAYDRQRHLMPPAHGQPA